MSGPIYHIAAADLRVVPLDGLTLVFHQPSGQTHFVAPPVPQILDALADGAADAATLLQRMAARFDLGDEAVAQSTLAARLAELDTLGLVRRQ